MSCRTKEWIDSIEWVVGGTVEIVVETPLTILEKYHDLAACLIWGLLWGREMRNLVEKQMMLELGVGW